MLIIDMPNLCLREAFAKAGLTHRGRPSGVVFGALQQLRTLMGRFPGEVCCCWDGPRKDLLRRRFWPGYKAARDDKETPEAARDAYPQMDLLREEILPRLGLPNQVLQEGYEADDLIAVFCNWPVRFNLNTGQIYPHVIISSDSDLFQLLGPRTSQYRFKNGLVKHHEGRGLYTHQMFAEEYNIAPMQWVEVKAIAGDSSDGIDGVPGVGVKTAVKHLRTGSGGGKLAQKIKAHAGVIARNRRLIRLPWPGCDPGPVRPSRFNEREFMRVCGEWGLGSLMR